MNDFAKTIERLIEELIIIGAVVATSEEHKLIKGVLKKNIHDFLNNESEDDDEGTIINDIRSALNYYEFIEVQQSEYIISDQAEEFLESNKKEYFLAAFTHLKRIMSTKYPNEIILALKYFTELSAEERHQIIQIERAGYEIEHTDVPISYYDTYQKLRLLIKSELQVDKLSAKRLFRVNRYGVKEIYEYDLEILKQLVK